MKIFGNSISWPKFFTSIYHNGFLGFSLVVCEILSIAGSIEVEGSGGEEKMGFPLIGMGE